MSNTLGCARKVAPTSLPWPPAILLGLSFSRSSCDVRWAYLMAASMVTMLPVILVFFLAQKLFIEGIAPTGMKG